MPSLRLPCSNDRNAINRLHAKCFGPGRFARTAYRIRESADCVTSCSRMLFDGDQLIASVELSKIEIGEQPGALLLGPLAVAPEYIGQANGSTLVKAAIEAARDEGYQMIVLVGDMAYYHRFDFEVVPPKQIALPGPVDPERILALELRKSALQKYAGLVRGTSM
ncbi:MAG: GNAT family N-acetyltransferase [Hyphomicrobiaceae bacterium]